MGIAVGMATNIPPHNLRELVDAILHLADHPQATVEDLLKFVKGPDFPTAGFVYDKEALKQAYLTGRGSVAIRGKPKEEGPVIVRSSASANCRIGSTNRP